MKQLILVLSAAALAACAVGPDYRPPATPPAAFLEAAPAGLVEEPFELAWWRQFDDPVLDGLIGRALAGDLDLEVAAARLSETRALLGNARRQRWPDGGAEIGYAASTAQQPGFTDTRQEITSYRGGLASVWELDLFGRTRRGVEAATADAEAAREDLRAARVAVAAEVAATYIGLRGTQKRLEVARANRDNQRETLRLTQVRLRLGRGTELDVASAEASLAETAGSIPPLVAAAAAARHRLAVLLGARPGALDAQLAPRDMPPHVTTLAVGEPESLLARRPDIRAAERRLAASTARIGVAEGDLFPRLSLSGFVGFIAGDAAELGESASRAWSLTPVLSWSGFDAGGRAKVAAAEARTAEARADYERTVLRALEETEDAFVDYGQGRERLVHATQQATASRRAAELARIQYREGALDFLRLLDAERSVLQAEDAVAAAEANVNAAVVGIYKALGGGWDVEPGPIS
jgi:multidrug efflux system outer membrane protein